MMYRLEERRLLGPRAYRTVWTTSYDSRAAALADLAAVAANMEEVCRPLRDDDGTELVPASGRSPYAHDGTHRLVLIEDSAARTADPDAADDTRPVPRAGLPGRVSRPSVAAPPPPPREAPPAPWSAGGARGPITAAALSGADTTTAAASTRTAAADGASSGPSLDVPAPPAGTSPPAGGVTPNLVVDPLAALGPRLVEPAPRHDPALDDPKLVWISVRRTGIDRHRPAPGVKWTAGPANAVYRECTDTACTDRRAAPRHAHLARTLCGRVIRTGELLATDDPWVVEHTTPCARCWPGGVA